MAAILKYDDVVFPGPEVVPAATVEMVVPVGPGAFGSARSAAVSVEIKPSRVVRRWARHCRLGSVLSMVNQP